MLNIKTLIATVLLSSIAAVSFAQTPVTAKDVAATAPAAVTAPTPATKAAPTVKKTVTKKHVAKKAHKASATKKAGTVVLVAPAAK